MDCLPNRPAPAVESPFGDGAVPCWRHGADAVENVHGVVKAEVKGFETETQNLLLDISRRGARAAMVIGMAEKPKGELVMPVGIWVAGGSMS